MNKVQLGGALTRGLGQPLPDLLPPVSLLHRSSCIPFPRTPSRAPGAVRSRQVARSEAQGTGRRRSSRGSMHLTCSTVSAGTGGNPTLGEQAAMESHEDLHQTVGGADMVRSPRLECPKPGVSAGTSG